jgi:two-component system, NtrC family, response regulator AtoC
MSSASILVVDDDKAFRLLAEEALHAERFEVRAVGTLARARIELAEAMPDVVILDRRLPDGDGLELLGKISEQGLGAPVVIVVTAYGDVENAVDALRAGAWDYLTKPVQLVDLVVKIHKVLETRGLRDRLHIAQASAAGAPPVAPKSAAMKQVIGVLERVAESPLTPVLLLGPSGAGKQRLAELLHEKTFGDKSGDAPFLQVNCAALPEDLIENELFGHERGAFTDAKATQRGLIELAAGGTLFLDEVTEMPLRSQAKLLKFLDGMRFRRLGGQREIAVELRVVAASNADIRERVHRGLFREDLFHRLSVFSVTVPPLRARREDIADLSTAFVTYFAARVKKRVTGLSPEALAALAAYDYPGNVRELRNIIERAVILTMGPTIVPRDLMFLDSPGAAAHAVGGFFGVALRDDGTPPPLDEVERAYVGRVLEHLGGHRTAAAQALGVSYPTFLRRLRELGLE